MLITFAKHFKVFIEIPSYPDESSVVRNFIVFIITVSVTGVIFISIVLAEYACFILLTSEPYKQYVYFLDFLLFV